MKLTKETMNRATDQRLVTFEIKRSTEVRERYLRSRGVPKESRVNDSRNSKIFHTNGSTELFFELDKMACAHALSEMTQEFELTLISITELIPPDVRDIRVHVLLDAIAKAQIIDEVDDNDVRKLVGGDNLGTLRFTDVTWGFWGFKVVAQTYFWPHFELSWRSYFEKKVDVDLCPGCKREVRRGEVVCPVCVTPIVWLSSGTILDDSKM